MTQYISSTAYMFESIFAALILTMGTGWLGIKVARRFGLLDIPGSDLRKQHQFPTPLAGGFALTLSLLVLLFASGLWKDMEIRRLMLAAVMVFAFGLWDDAKTLPPLVKLAGQLCAAVLLIFSGIQIQLFETGTFFVGAPRPAFIWFDRALTIFWIIGVTNAFNLVDSMDGLSVGLAAWAFGFFMLATFDSQQTTLSILSAMLLGICLALNYYNASPARLFLGDAGALQLGFLFAGVAILYTPQASAQTSSWFVPILLVGIPIFDTSLVVFSRIRRGKPFYQSGRDHTYHRLVDLGLNPHRAVLTMHLGALLLECVAFIALPLPPIFANILFLCCLLFGGIGIMLLDRPARWP